MARIHWLDVVIAPLTWLERARGWRRLALLGLYAVIVGVGGVLVGREAVLWQLPDVREPVAAADDGHVDLADADNAMVPYREAMRLLRRDDEVIRGLERLPPGGWDWATASPAARAWAEGNRPTLAAWLAATQRRDCLVAQPGEIPRPDDQGLATYLYREFAILATLEATRRQAAGDLSGAWELDLARFRSGLLAGRHTGLNGQVTATMTLARCPPAVTAWAADPALTADLAHRALRDLIACRPW